MVNGEKLLSVKELIPEDIEIREALQKFLSILTKMYKLGLLDLIEGLIDRDVIKGLVSTFLTTGVLKILDNFDKITDAISKIDFDKLDLAIDTLNSALEVLSKKEIKPIGILGMLRSLRDENAKKGLAILIDLLKTVGSNYQSV